MKFILIVTSPYNKLKPNSLTFIDATLKIAYA